MISTGNSCRTLVLTDAGSSGNPWNLAVDLTVTDAGQDRTRECYYAAGAGCTAHVRRDMSFQWQLTNDAGSLIRSASENHPTPVDDLPGEKTTSQQIVNAISGSVETLRKPPDTSSTRFPCFQ